MSSLQSSAQLSSYQEGFHQFFDFQYTPQIHLELSGSPPDGLFLTPPQEIPPPDLHDPTIYQYGDAPSPSFSESLPPPPLYESPLLELQDPQVYPSQPIKRLRSGNRIPRPRNAFMIFRSEFWAKEKITKSVEHDHRHISRIIGHCWNQLPEEEKELWRQKAQKEKAEHALRYPGYRFSPAVRLKKPIKRNVKRNGKEELLRCKKVAELLLAGKAGEELNSAVKTLSPTKEEEIEGTADSSLSSIEPVCPESNLSEPDPKDIPVFRSPLLPPTAPSDTIPPMFHQRCPSPATPYRETTPLTPLETNQAFPASIDFLNGYQEASYQSMSIASQGELSDWSTSSTPSRGAAYNLYPSHLGIRTTPLPTTHYPHTIEPPAPHFCFTNPFYSAAVNFSNHGPASLDPLHWDVLNR